MKEEAPLPEDLQHDPQTVYEHFPEGIGEMPPEDIPGVIRIRMPGVKLGEAGKAVFDAAMVEGGPLRNTIDALHAQQKKLAVSLEHNGVTIFVAKHKKAIIGGAIGAGLAAGGLLYLRNKKNSPK